MVERECHETVSCRVVTMCCLCTGPEHPLGRPAAGDSGESSDPRQCPRGAALPQVHNYQSWDINHTCAVTVMDLPVEILITNMIRTGVFSNQSVYGVVYQKLFLGGLHWVP